MEIWLLVLLQLSEVGVLLETHEPQGEIGGKTDGKAS